MKSMDSKGIKVLTFIIMAAVAILAAGEEEEVGKEGEEGICGKNFYKEFSSGECKPCVSNCSKCEDDSTCIICSSEGFYLHRNGTCANCMENCQFCFEEDFCEICLKPYRPMRLSGRNECSSPKNDFEFFLIGFAVFACYCIVCACYYYRRFKNEK